MTSLRFSKMHGLGNDFMLIDMISQPTDIEPAEVRAWADRRTGIGFDQLLGVLPPETPSADFRLRIVNADGTDASQCGNGSACAATFVLAQQLTKRPALRWETPGGGVLTQVVSESTGGTRVAVTMGVPSFPTTTTAPGRLPTTLRCDVVVDGVPATLNVTPISLGNPHAITFVDDVAASDLNSLGPNIQMLDEFPNSTNVEFVQVVSSSHLKLRTFERGVGETQACGSGACAAVVASRLHDLVEDLVTVEQPGGSAQVSWADVEEPVKITIPAVHVYGGTL